MDFAPLFGWAMRIGDAVVLAVYAHVQGVVLQFTLTTLIAHATL